MLKALFLCIAMASASAHAATTLKESYLSALKRSESLSSQEKLVLIAEERYSQARGNILPNLTANASYTIQDRPTDPLAAAFFPREQPEAKLTLRQPIFRGLRELAALSQFDHLSEAEKHSLENAKLLLYNDVAQSYYMVLAVEEDLRNINDQLKLYDERISELTHRVRAGTSSETDLLSLQASRAGVRSQFETAQSAVAAARESFAFVTGLSRSTKLASVGHEQERPQPIEEYLKRIEKRPDILSLVEREQAADEQIGYAKGAHYPTIDLLGNYYFKRQSDIYKGIDWDVQAALSFPIFAGGTISAQVRESTLQRERADLELARLRRQAEQQIRTLYSNYIAGLDSITALEQSLQLAEKNYLLLKRDYSRGLTRNLDVLQGLISSHEARRALLRARYASRDTWVQLNTAAASRPSL